MTVPPLVVRAINSPNNTKSALIANSATVLTIQDMTTYWHCPELLDAYKEALAQSDEEVIESASSTKLLVEFRQIPELIHFCSEPSNKEDD